ncbi:hypothetical protein HYD28_11780 [Pseudoalteromonas shioyasakiensis]|nr:hypothetical protein HYD28_11780 [Pseudoalteromonas shioyasakiensis]
MILIDYFDVCGTSSYPDDFKLFSDMEKVTYKGKDFWLCHYSGNKRLESPESDEFISNHLGSENDAKPVIELSSPTITGEGVSLGNGGIWWVKQNTQFTLVASAQLPDSEMMLVVERVINGSTVVDDIRVKASIVNGLITMDAQFEQSGNYQITAQRLNAGLEIIEAPFRLAFDKVEFDAYV